MFFHDNALVLWNYRLHEQYELDSPHLNELLKLARGDEIQPDYQQAFRDAGIITDTEADGWSWDIMSRIFHLGTKDIPISANKEAKPKEWIEEYLDYCEKIGDPPEYEKSDELPAAAIDLPAAQDDAIKAMSLREVLYKRKTCRQFYDEPVSLQALSNILYYSFGYIHGAWEEEFAAAGLVPTAKRKSSPSGGGLHPVEAYVTVFNVTGLDNDIYWYDAENHQLRSISDTPIDLTDDLTEVLWGQYYSKGLSFGIFLTGKMDLAAWKYKHSRAYRNVLLDTGHISQTFQLCATAQGLNTWITGAFNDSRIEEILNIDGMKESILFYVSAGVGSPVAFDDKMREVVDASD